ncbi:DUF1254 domain-containing protein [Oceanicoccus sp. KOV_DT_Chl]|uniref:DUF1254 domain-containing protein n=1 Tax=Oceanicoccus sp. KOV_DT_Chl TaxID=1904639 RepID=UPI001F4876BC|nr:DUF1254 domain-containing protein [Oceanicoccus sp. KOV_DT_Chl]
MNIANSFTAILTTAGIALSSFSIANAEVSQKTLDSISIADKLETPIGNLEFFDGVPTDATINKLYDNLDRSRGLGVYLDNMGGVSINAVLDGLSAAGANASNKVALFEQLMDSQTLVVTANTSTLYAYAGTDLGNDGPTVIEVPPGMLGFLDDGWQRFVGNIGVTGPDKGKGGKYLVLPPAMTAKYPVAIFYLNLKPIVTFCFCAAPSKRGLNLQWLTSSPGLKFIR